ncbi:hypothetical protein [Chryseobacterium sp. A301]
MKTSTTFIKRKYEKLSLLAIMFFASIFAFAQETTEPLDVDVTTSTKTTTTSTEWMSNPLYWVIGGLVLIILIAVIVRGNNRD